MIHENCAPRKAGVCGRRFPSPHTPSSRDSIDKIRVVVVRREIRNKFSVRAIVDVGVRVLGRELVIRNFIYGLLRNAISGLQAFIGPSRN